MSEDLVNQITLNFLISKSQLEKLNKKMKYDADNNKKTNIEVYGLRIRDLFNELLVNEPPTDLLQDVKTGFDFFLEKCIYYFKLHDDNSTFEHDRNAMVQEQEQEQEQEQYSNNDLDELDDEPLALDEEDKDEEDEDEKEDDAKKSSNVNIRQKIRKTSGMQQLPLDWFHQVRQTYKQNQIIPRTTEIVIEQDTHIRDFNCKNKNIDNLYDIKNKKKS
jgi:hypothetical protein